MPFTDSSTPYVIPEEPLTSAQTLAILTAVEGALLTAVEQLDHCARVATRLARGPLLPELGTALGQLANQVEVARLDVRGYRTDLAQLVRHG